jgi:hypothetical protein
MGIFDLFKKKDKNTSDQQQEAHSINPNKNETKANINSNETSNAIEIISDNQGSHGNNFGGLLGFGYLSSQSGNQFILEMIALASIQKPSLEDPVVKISEVSFENSPEINIKTITKNYDASKGDILSAFPYIKTNYTLPFRTKKIIEWSHSANMEAEIQGGGRDTFGLSFFATDYVKNKRIYQTQNELNIKISAVGLVLEKSDLTEINGVPVNPDFSAYMPSKDILRPTYFDFIGVLNSYKECRINSENNGYFINVKLINQEDDPNFFTIDLFINKENMRFTDLTKGMKVTGALWLQGEIA